MSRLVYTLLLEANSPANHRCLRLLLLLQGPSLLVQVIVALEGRPNHQLADTHVVVSLGIPEKLLRLNQVVDCVIRLAKRYLQLGHVLQHDSLPKLEQVEVLCVLVLGQLDPGIHQLHKFENQASSRKSSGG